MNKNQIALIIVAAGSSSRMGGQIKKEYLPLNKGTVLSESALIFLKTEKISSLTIVYPEKSTDSEIQKCKDALFKNPEIKSTTDNLTQIYFIEGGSTRQESVYKGLKFLKDQKPDFVLIHDGARPFLSIKLVENSILNTIKYGSSAPAIKPTDTQKEINSDGFIVKHLVRNNLRAIQTPQGFSFDKILLCHEKAHKDKTEYTDDTEIYDKYSGQKTFLFDGEIENKKITYIEDLKSIQNKTNGEAMFRTGIGYDKHKLVENRKLILGGVEIPFEKGEDGHSDGDAVLHAITDSLLGAAHLGDIGSYFPDTDPAYKNADSKRLLSAAWNDVKKEGFKLENLDIVILLEKPKFLSYRDKVISSIADVLDVSEDKVFIKAKTGEKLGDVGNGNCIEVFATCLLKK